MSGKIITGDRVILVEDARLRAARAATGLSQLGPDPEQAIAIFLRNDVAFMEATETARILGLYAVPVNWHYGPEEANYILNDCNVCALVIHADLYRTIKDGIPENVRVFVVETPKEIRDAYGLAADQCTVPDGCTNWYEWLEQFEPMDKGDTPSPGAMIYTSGTTGNPKGVRRKPKNDGEMDAMMAVIKSVFGLREGVRTIIPAPMYHSAPNSYSAISFNGNLEEIVLMPRFDTEEFLQLIDKHKTTHVQTVPTMFVRLLKLPDDVRTKYDTSSLEFVVHAAAPCPQDVKEKMINWWGPVINEYYGSTETSAVVFCNSEEWLAHRGTVGKAVQTAEIRILNDEGDELPIGTIGDVYCRIMSGPDFTYNNDDGKRAKAEKLGLIGVGDIGYVDEDGFLFLCDRRNDMVISGGVNIYPAEIEACLLGHGAVADCAVFGIPDEDFGEALCAYVQMAPGQTISETEVRSHVREHLASYKSPKVVEFAAELPREDSGKIFKRKLREPYWEGHENRI